MTLTMSPTFVLVPGSLAGRLGLAAGRPAATRGRLSGRYGHPARPRRRRRSRRTLRQRRRPGPRHGDGGRERRVRGTDPGRDRGQPGRYHQPGPRACRRILIKRRKHPLRDRPLMMRFACPVSDAVKWRSLLACLLVRPGQASLCRRTRFSTSCGATTRRARRATGRVRRRGTLALCPAGAGATGIAPMSPGRFPGELVGEVAAAAWAAEAVGCALVFQGGHHVAGGHAADRVDSYAGIVSGGGAGLGLADHLQ